jgi:outer membrane lipoprotein-sorting protein
MTGAGSPGAPALTAAQIADMNVSARGGAATWHAVRSMTLLGKIEAGGKQNMKLPFVVDLKRPRKARIELQFQGQTAVQVYDGNSGWKLRPFLGRQSVEPYASDEIKEAPADSDLGGPFVDYATKGTKVELQGTEEVEGRDAYKLKLTSKNGDLQRVWVDAQTFLDVKVDGSPRRLDGKLHEVATYLREYKSVQGLMIPHVFETAVEGVKQTEKITIESIVLNPELDDLLFKKPE